MRRQPLVAGIITAQAVAVALLLLVAWASLASAACTYQPGQDRQWQDCLDTQRQADAIQRQLDRLERDADFADKASEREALLGDPWGEEWDE